MTSLAVTDYNPTLHDDLTWCLSQCRSQVVRPIAQWVEDELIVPNGPYRGERFRHRRHPASRLWFEALGDPHWNRFAASGPTQNGKTLMCYVAPVMYHLFEMRETVIIGLPTMAMAQDKWTEDLLPAIEASRYASLLPIAGEGSRGGLVKRAIQFRNGVTLRFMSGGGGDKQRAGYTSRVLAVTETDGMDESGETSREADKIEQLEGRTRAYGSTKRVYLECTVSIESGRIWQEITRGSDSRIFRECVHCGAWVCPERDHLVGWRDAETELEAAERAAWACGACGELWTDEQRCAAARSAVLVHRGQKVLPGGQVVGEVPQTRTLGFRWSAIDNPFASTADLGAEEWRASRALDRENAEKKQRQFIWCLPWVPPAVELTPLLPDEVARRTTELRRGIVPPDTVGIAVGIDTGKQRLHWHAAAIRQDGSVHVIEYGEQITNAGEVGTLRGLVDALTALHAYFSAGWQDETGKLWTPQQVWIDSGWHEHRTAVYQFCQVVNAGRDLGQEIYRPMKGHGERQRSTTRYIAPRSKGNDVRYIGREYDLRFQKEERILLVHVNSDYWKSELHQRLAMASSEPGAMTLYHAASPREHTEYSEHITAESQREQWIPGRGEVIVWERLRRNNHYLDAGYISLAAGDFIRSECERMKLEAGELTLAEMARRAAAGATSG